MLTLKGKFIHTKINVLGFKHYTAGEESLYIPVYTTVEKISNIHDIAKLHINDYNLDSSVKVVPELNELNLIEISPVEENILSLFHNINIITKRIS